VNPQPQPKPPPKPQVNTAVAQYQRVLDEASDHFPVVVDLRLAALPRPGLNENPKSYTLTPYPHTLNRKP